jgi:deoxyribose-phosphate aldolase
MTTADLAGSVQHTEARATADRTRIERVLSECEAHGFDATIRLMSELGGLTDGEAKREIEYAVGAGFDYRKNSSGFGVGGQATVDRIRCIADRVDGSVGVKASGGITTAAEARALLDAGADLLGASSGVAIVAGGEGENGC